MTQFLTRRESMQGGAMLGVGLLAGCLGVVGVFATTIEAMRLNR